MTAPQPATPGSDGEVCACGHRLAHHVSVGGCCIGACLCLVARPATPSEPPAETQQADELEWVEPFFRWAKTDKSPGSYSAAFAAGWAASRRAGAGEQQRERVEALIRRYNTGKPSWSVAEFADELLALLGGPQPDGEAVAAARACWCAHCEGIVLAADHPTNWVARIGGRRFIVCRDCGDKRCPRAAHHDRPCAYREPCPVYSHGESGWHCAVTGDHEQHTNAAGDVTW